MMDNLQAILETLSKNQKQLTELVKANGLHTKTPANTATYTRLHGLGGLVASPGMEREIISTHVRPHGLSFHPE